MATHPTPIDISNMPDLMRLVEEVEVTKQPRKLMRDKETIALLVPVAKAEKKSTSQKRYKAFLAAAGSLKGLLDADELKEHIAESRKIASRPVIRL